MVEAIAAGAGAARRHRRLPWWIGVAVGLWGFGGLGAAAAALADSRQPADFEAVGYAAAEHGGASLSWVLPEGAPYLFVPAIGSSAGDSVAAVDTGARVGAVLFQRPYFRTRDSGCAPELGSDSRPDLKWRGATARFAPPVEAPPEPAGAHSAAAHSAAAAAERIYSLILYRKDLGPPPGALFLDRRLTIGLNCGRAVHKTFFNRIFVPIAAPPEPARCFNLAGTYAQQGGKDVRVDFASADRLVLLQPADADDRYRAIRHRFRVTLYDGEGCRGGTSAFRSAGPEPGDIKLDQVGLRDRVRSLKIVYEGGPLAPYYAVPATTPVAATEPTAPPAATSLPAAAAAPKQAEAPTPAPAARQVPAVPSPGASPSPVEAASKQVEAPAPPSVATQEPAAPPRTASTSVAEAAPKQAAAPAPAPVPPSPAPAAPAPAPAKAPADEMVAGASPAPKTVDAAAAPITLQVAMPPPRLEMPKAKPTEPGAKPASKTFEYPVYEIYRLNYCLRWGADCGEPAASAWCRVQGFARASTWQVDKNIGSYFPTIVLTEKRICAQSPCDGFQEITCSN